MRDIKAPLKANQVAIGSLATELSALLANATVAEQSAEALSSSVSYFQTEDAVKLLGTINTAVGDSAADQDHRPRGRASRYLCFLMSRGCHF